MSENIWSNEDVKTKLSLMKKLILKVRGFVFLRYERRKGWKGFLPIYLVKCKKHNIFFEDYPHGYSMRFDCPLCLQEFKESKGEKIAVS